MFDEKQVVFVEWSSKGRDFEVDLPLMYFFEKVLEWKVEYISIFNLPKILNTNPNLIIMSNTTGADVNLKMARLIEKSNIPLFSHVSEGMFREENIEEFVWGWNKKEKRFSEKLSMLWSKKAYEMSVKSFPETSKTYRVSGSVGFDKYKLYKQNKIDTLGYKKVIGYAGFDFHNIMSRKDYFIKEWGKDKFQSFMNIAVKINSILDFLIENNKDVLFLLKSHPGDGKKVPLEFQGLLDKKNTQIIQSNISIVDVISNSDIWLNYNSSTNLETWLLGKPSISFNIDETTFSSNILFGSLLENNYHKIQNYIDEYYQSGIIKKFEEKKELRERLISEYIGFSDGLNHVRFMSFLKPYIEKVENGEIEKRRWNISLKNRAKAYIKHIVYSIAKGKYKTPYIKKWAHICDMFDDKEVEEQKKLRFSDFDKFYKNNQNKIEDIYNNHASNWKNELDIK